MLFALLIETAIANAGLLGVSPNSLYSVDVQYGPTGGVTINGPHGTEEFLSQSLFGLQGLDYGLINNYGQFVGVSDGGTDDPTIYFALYGSGGGNFDEGHGSYIGVVPTGVGFGFLVWPDEGCSHLPCDFPNGLPQNLHLTNSGVVTTEIYLSQGLPIDTWQWFLPNHTTPEPSYLLLLMGLFSGLSLQRLLCRCGSTKGE